MGTLLDHHAVYYSPCAHSDSRVDQRLIRKSVTAADIRRTGGRHRRHRHENPKHIHARLCGSPITNGDNETVHGRTPNTLVLVTLTAIAKYTKSGCTSQGNGSTIAPMIDS